MTKDEALDLALEALENSVDLVREDAYNAEKLYGNYPTRQGKVRGLKALADDHEKAITAIKQARALDKMADNARKLGLDYEPADGTQVSKVWWDGEKLMAKPIPLEDIYLPAPECTRSHPHENMDAMCELRTEIARLTNENARLKAIAVPVQEPVAQYSDIVSDGGLDPRNKFDIQPAAQPAPVPDLTHDQWDKWQDKHSLILERDALDELRAMLNTPPAAAVQEGRDWSLLEATQESLREHMAEIKRLKEAQPAVPDALTSADIQEHIEYVAGWNDCRAEMLKGMKP
jgi:hypothetical protein